MKGYFLNQNIKQLNTQHLTYYFHRCHLPLLYIGLECGLTNNVRLAEKFFQQAQNIAPDDPFVMHEMGVIAFQNLKYSFNVIKVRKFKWNDFSYKAAEKHFKDALNRIRSNQDATMVEKWEPLLNNLGHTCRKLKKYDESLEYHHQVHTYTYTKLKHLYVYVLGIFRPWCYHLKMRARIQQSDTQKL